MNPGRSHSSLHIRTCIDFSTLNAVPVLAYENTRAEAEPFEGTNNRKKKKKRSNRPLEGARFCTFHQLYGHDTSECSDAPRSLNQSTPSREEYPRRSTSPNRGERRYRDQSLRRRESRDKGESRHRDQVPSGGQVIMEIDIIIGGPHIEGNTRNAQRNYTREVKDPSMITYIVNQTQEANMMAPITFSQEDAQGVHHPHCDALVIRVVMARNGLKRMLIDNYSSMNILFGSTFDKIQIEHGLTTMTGPLFGFISNSIIPRGRITLPVEMGSASPITHHFVEFLVVDYRSAYHEVLGRLALKDLWVVISIHYLCMKFPNEHVIATV
ncbi:uncharacterized protein LOC111393053 [Olea europaea var. sylvestris]|uniref:uncharacterized protein LOC111393053 n=1 Tax=Olea europaea var. sylvestris TaxID=158386 RepID=UPI000C1D3583|nr:uncharacterized protein LOC111393053 [Olea europaea var. sylvestris]